MKLKFFKKKMVEKSFSPTSRPTASVYLDNQGNIIDTRYSTVESEIRKNASISTIMSKQLSMIDEAALVVKEKSEKSDKVSENKAAKEFLSWIEKPNTVPSPVDRRDIFNHMISEYWKCGVSAAVFTFGGSVKMNTFKNIKLAKSVQINNVGSQITYRVYLGDTNDSNYLVFEFSNETLQFTHESGGEVMVLFVPGNYSITKSCYISPFEEIIQYVMLQNYVVEFSTSFYKNSCFPSQIVQLTYKNLKDGVQLSPAQQKDFKEAVEQVKLQLKQTKGSGNAGKMIVPNHPSLEIKITPLSITTNSEDSLAYQNLAAKKIFAFVDGGSIDAFEGESEFANNASAKLKELYDGAFRSTNAILIKKLSAFMNKIFLVTGVAIDASKTYLNLDVSKVSIYQKSAVIETMALKQNGIVTANESRKIVKESSEKYGDLESRIDGELLDNSGSSMDDTPSI